MEDGPPSFSPGSTCLLILRIPPADMSCVYRIITFSDALSHTLRLYMLRLMAVLTPDPLLVQVWPLPLSLATTRGISVDFSSSRYLDVSVPGVPLVYLCIQYTIHGSSPWVFPHSEIRGYNAHLQLPAAYRSLSRPSSAPDAKAFTLCSFLLELLCGAASAAPLLVLFQNCLSFKTFYSLVSVSYHSHKKVFLLCSFSLLSASALPDLRLRSVKCSI